MSTTTPPKKTKIVATIGPASEKKDMIARLLRAGMNVARLNMSHGNHDEHGARIQTLRKISKKEHIPVGILMDLAGPKIRTGELATDSVELTPGKQLILTTDTCVGTHERMSINYPTLPKEVRVGGMIMLEDGKKRLRVARIEGNDIVCDILIGGTIKPRRGVNVPGAYLSISSLSTKDKKDVAWGSRHVDFVALSFVRNEKDILELRALLKKQKSSARIIAKIETLEAVEQFEKILAVTDGVMVARGDLAVEIGPEKVPAVQKMIIKKAQALGKPVITATQMLESMTRSPIPTRAEVSDVANAIYDGTDAVMLSEETAAGLYPEEAVAMMTHIAQETEAGLPAYRGTPPAPGDTIDAVSLSVVRNAYHVHAKAIVTLTESGSTTRMIARWRPGCPIIVMTTKETTCAQSLLSFGAQSYLVPRTKGIHSTLPLIKKLLIKEQIAKPGDRVVVTAGIPFGTPGSTNMMLVYTL